MPLARRQALGIAVMSYDGHLGFGLLGDYDALPELEAIARDLKWAIAVAGARRRRAPPAKRRERRKPPPAPRKRRGPATRAKPARRARRQAGQRELRCAWPSAR